MNMPDITTENIGKPSDQSEGFFFVDSASCFNPGMLALANGTAFKGFCPRWQKGQFDGEVVFSTGMTGYDASLTDPSYTGQILVFTYPLIGNYGIPTPDRWESKRVHASGIIVSTHCDEWSHGKSTQSLLQWLEKEKVPLLTGVDTRALTKVLRETGSMLGCISTEASVPKEIIDPNWLPLGKRVSVKSKLVYQSLVDSLVKVKKVILVDCGMKQNILRNLQKFPLTIEQVPYNYDYSEEEYDGVFLSNGPGDPALYTETITVLRKAMKRKKTIFGICLGTQLMALAAGAKTYKLRYGHRGHNQPCIETETKRCFITSQNHGYAISEESLPKEWKVSFRNLNDNTVEGINHSSLPFSAVQFHPEAAPGPTDTKWLFERFYHTL